MPDRYYVFPNIEPTLRVIESLGFERIAAYREDVYSKQFGGRECRLALFWQTSGWDTSDETWLEFRYDDKVFAVSPYSSLSFPDRFYMGTHGVPTAEQIKAAICATFERAQYAAKHALKQAYADYLVVENLSWET